MEFILILLLPTISLATWNQTKCNRLKIGDKFYEREEMLTNIDRPYNLNLHKPSNCLFFSYTTPESYSVVDFQLAYFNLDTKELQIVAGIRGGCTVAIDADSDEIYMGGSDGIYKYNMQTKLADFYKEKGQNIWSLFHKRNLFYISYPDQKLHLEIDGKFSVVKEFWSFQTDHFFVTDSNEMFFANQSGLYQIDHDKMIIVPLNDLLTVRQFVEDNEGHLYICTNFGIFTLSKTEGLKRVVDENKIYGMAFDRNNDMIISESNTLWRLIPSDKGCESKIFW